MLGAPPEIKLTYYSFRFWFDTGLQLSTLLAVKLPPDYHMHTPLCRHASGGHRYFTIASETKTRANWAPPDHIMKIKLLLALAVGIFVAGFAPAQENRLTIRADQGKLTISKNIYGHFSEHLGRCIYEGIWVGEDSPIPNTRGMRNDIIDALRALNIPNLRWPGGCFADEYHWLDGMGPREQRT